MDFSRYRRTNLHRTSDRRPYPLFLVRTLLALTAMGCAPTALADNPGFDRPGYGFTPAVLAAGSVSIEQGLPDWSRNRQDAMTTAKFSADSLLRVGLGGPLEFQLGSSPWNSSRQTGEGITTTRRGHGDTLLGLKLALPSSHPAFSWGLLGSVELTDGDPDFRNDRKQYLLGTQVNLQVSEHHSLGLYVEDVRSGGSDSSTVAMSDSIALGKTLTLYAESALLHPAGERAGTVAGAGLAWLVDPHVQLDAGFDHRVSGTASQWQANLGVSVYFGD